MRNVFDELGESEESLEYTVVSLGVAHVSQWRAK